MHTWWARLNIQLLGTQRFKHLRSENCIISSERPEPPTHKTRAVLTHQLRCGRNRSKLVGDITLVSAVIGLHNVSYFELESCDPSVKARLGRGRMSRGLGNGLAIFWPDTHGVPGEWMASEPACQDCFCSSARTGVVHTEVLKLWFDYKKKQTGRADVKSTCIPNWTICHFWAPLCDPKSGLWSSKQA